MARQTERPGTARASREPENENPRNDMENDMPYPRYVQDAVAQNPEYAAGLLAVR